MNYTVATTSVRSLTIASADSRTLTAQGPVEQGTGQAFKDLVQSTPAAPIIAAKKLRDEKIDGLVHQVVVITLSITKVDGVSHEPYRCSSTLTVKFPKKYASNGDLNEMALAIWTTLASNGTAGTLGTSTNPSQLEKALKGDLN